MSISGILSSSFLQNQLSAVSSPYQQDMQKLSQDLQTGNLSAAQSDFATLQAAFSQTATSTGAGSTASTSGASTSNPVAQAFNQLGTDLKSGNLSAAQKDFSTVQQDLQSQGGPSTGHLHHHHRISPGNVGEDPTDQNVLLQDLNQVGQNLTSGNLAGAQQAYATLQQQLQTLALGGGTLSSSQTNAMVAQPLVSLEV
jgi:hypothetical protein